MSLRSVFVRLTTSVAPQSRTLCAGLLVVLYCCVPAVAEESESTNRSQLETQGQTELNRTELNQAAAELLDARCTKCHGTRKQSAKLDLSSLNTMLQGGKRGAAILPGDAAGSRLLQLVQPGAKPHMPPGKKQLTDDEIGLLTNWINSLPKVAKPKTETSADLATQPDANSAESSTTRWTPPQGLDPTSVIDLFVQTQHQRQTVVANPVCTDAEFVRRLYLDLIGRIPTSDEANSFLSDTNSTKRADLIDRLLASKESAQHLARMFDTMLMGRNERHRDDRYSRGWMAYLTQVFQDNTPWNIAAQEILLARGDSKEDRGHIWYLHERNGKHQEIAEAVAKHFFGVDVACAQCHDHPLAGEIEQGHYWGLVAFFNRSKNENAANGIAIGESAVGGFNDFANALEGTTEQASLVFLGGKQVPEQRPAKPDQQKDADELYIKIEAEPRVPKFSRREQFVSKVLTDHPLVARSMTNRLWAMMMGRGIVHPAEKMDSDHPPSHPALLDWLAEDFRQNEHNIRRLLQCLANSRTYQLDSKSSTAGPTVADELFTRAIEKPLTAEMFFDSLVVLLNVEQDESTKSLLNQVSAQLRDQFPEVLPENNLTTLKQTMWMTNSPQLQQLFDLAAEQFDHESSLVDQLTSLYRRGFQRAPTDDELFALAEYIRSRPESPQKAFSQVLWAIAMSAEFRFNH